jgi:hypothetical protein
MYSSYHFEYKRPPARFSDFSRRPASPSPINSGTYSRNFQNTRKSNAALLLTLFVPVSPLLRYSYKKMGGGGYPEIIPSESLGLLEVFKYLPELLNVAESDQGTKGG